MDQNSIEQIFQQKLEDLQIENHPTQLLEGLKLLLKLFDNIGQNPLEQKYRNIKATNTKIKNLILDQKLKPVKILESENNKEGEVEPYWGQIIQY
ncbi:hypothetical protein IMG5_029440 [Ichthyophthirius multifiliis]|uniref:PUB domain-containing protein n=1 Tax=Ichthyophthirius multifiliis TaxID=5932 RepID=G0QLE4_ICHMU|nr:hypothetical protein IMG5_029440 [Ichthyophthirius multifiliis]EGR33960.1 hypothetical protein IMG5_029440 [Ichthyophthirius multifiliis]|eukprot:XP_004039264.1 hypothetical protein IMG5_029440 [Ichthyophthirius multifiliis]